MSQNEIISKIEQLKEWEAILEEAQAEAEAIRDCIKAQMLEEETEELSEEDPIDEDEEELVEDEEEELEPLPEEDDDSDEFIDD